MKFWASGINWGEGVIFGYTFFRSGRVTFLICLGWLKSHRPPFPPPPSINNDRIVPKVGSRGEMCSAVYVQPQLTTSQENTYESMEQCENIAFVTVSEPSLEFVR